MFGVSRTVGYRAAAIFAVMLLSTACSGTAEEAADDSSDEAADSGREMFTPDDTVTFMVPAPPGGGSDIMVRSLESFYRTLDEADSSVDNWEVYDAYVRLINEHEAEPNVIAGSTSGPSYVWAAELDDIDFTWRDFTQLAIFSEEPQFLVAPGDSSLNSVDAVHQAAQEGTLTVAMAGSGGVNAVTLRQFEEELGVSFEPVIFDSGGEQLTALLAEDVDLSIMEPGEFVGQLESGDVQALLSFGAQQHPSAELAEVPTASEAGLSTNFVQQFRNFVAPAGITQEAQDYWIDVLRRWTESAEFDEYVANTLAAPVFISGDDAVQYIEESEETFLELMSEAAGGGS